MDSIDVEKLIAEVFDHAILYNQSLSAYKIMNEKTKCGRKLHYLWTPKVRRLFVLHNEIDNGFINARIPH